ncbi:MAG: TonB family protein [Marinobacterium sp.]|nr:TonB family protein [Marinobacterium sp.]
MLRTLAMLPVAVALSLTLFLGLYQLAGLGRAQQKTAEPNPQFDFLQVRRDTSAELLERSRPEPPPETQTEPMPDMPSFQTDSPQPIDAPQLEVEMPHIELGLKLDVKPSLAGLQAPAMPTVDRSAIPLVRVPPRYPRRAIRRGLEGAVTVEFTVNPDGTVKPGSIKVIKSDPPGVFDKAVKKSILRWRFKSRTRHGQPVEFRAQQTLEFKLEK